MTVIFLLLISTMIIFTTFISLQIKKNIVEQRDLLNAKICQNKAVNLHLDYVKSIRSANHAILLSNIGYIVPSVRIASSSIRKIISYAQEVKYYYYVLRILALNECPKNIRITFINPQPYKRELSGFKRENPVEQN